MSIIYIIRDTGRTQRVAWQRIAWILISLVPFLGFGLYLLLGRSPGHGQSAQITQVMHYQYNSTDLPASNWVENFSQRMDENAPQHDSLIGQQLDEYLIISQLGQGGMARIYLGQDQRLRRYVAIKIINKPLRITPEYVRQFEQEAQTIAQLEHPHIIRLYRYGEASGQFYMAMQYVQGADLAAVINAYHGDGEFMPPDEARRFIREVASALDYAHRRGVIHRDVKPSNIMFDEEGRAILADFGLAFYGVLGEQIEVFGTPHYMSPEQVESASQVVPESDLYALGVILYQIFTGRLPFEGGSSLEIAERQRSEEPRPPREIRPELGERLEAVILKALSKNPRERYPSGEALANALDTALTSSSTLPLPAGSPLTIHEQVTTVQRPIPLQSELPSPEVPGNSQKKQVRQRRWVPILPAILVVLIILLCFSIGFAIPRLLGLNTAALQPTASPSPEVPTVSSVVPTSLPALTPSLAPTRTPPPDTPPTPSPTAQAYQLEIVWLGEDSLFVINRASEPFPLAGLVLRGEQGQVDGAEWGVASLPPGYCVTLWKAEGQPQAPAVTCERSGVTLTRDGTNRFWKQDFAVFYQGEQIALCSQSSSSCQVIFPR